MEHGGGGDGDIVGGPAGMRWNPTTDQITLLESMYKQGIRTPSAEQIQQITARLKVYGHIEGKNVFYWFQNHKARQRQKQKQDNIAYFNRCFRSTAPMVYPPANFQNVVCSPYYFPTNDRGFFERYPKVILQGGISKRQTSSSTNYTFEDSKQETLPLFPLEPSGVLQTRNSSTSHDLAPSNSTTPSSSSSEIDEKPNFFNFLAVNGSCKGD